MTAPEDTELGQFAEPSLLILDSLISGPKHGYALMTDIETRTGRSLGPGTLYAALARLEALWSHPGARRGGSSAAVRTGRAGRPAPRDATAAALTLQRAGAAASRGAFPMKALLRLYPSTWRARYGAEMTYVLEQRGRRLLDAPDLIRGALDAHLHPAAIGDGATTLEGDFMSLRRAGWAALLGARSGPRAPRCLLLRLPRQAQRTLDRQGTVSGVGQSWLLTLLVAPALLVFAQVVVTRSLALRRPWHWVKWLPALVCSFGALLMTGKLFVNVVRPDRPTARHEPARAVGRRHARPGGRGVGIRRVAPRHRSRAPARRRVAADGSLLNAAFLSLIGAVHVMTALRYSTGIIAGGTLFGLGWMVLGVVLLRRASAASPSTPVAIVT